jgi:hypothetical protein
MVELIADYGLPRSPTYPGGRDQSSGGVIGIVLAEIMRQPWSPQ